jgi:Uma2 family endonuclease
MVAGTRLVTVEEFEQIAARPENAAKRLEYIGGEMVEMVSNNYSSMVASKVSFFIQLYLVQHGYEGYVTGADGGYQVADERYIPDVAFIAKARQPEPSHATYNPNPPNLAVEVLSPTDDPGDTRIKITNYLAVGTTVWIIDPDKKRVEVHAAGRAAQRLGMADTLAGGDVLPDFQLAVKDLFPD